MSATFTLFDVGGISEAQYYGLLASKLVAASCSVIGSVLIILIANHKARKHFYHRLMMVLSVTDTVSSFTYLLSPFLMPQESGYPLAVGSPSTCTASAFLFHTFYSMTAILNATLSISFVLVVRYNLQNEKVAKYTEKPTYAFALLVAPLFPILALINKAFGANPFVHYCSYMDTPPGCNNRGTPCLFGAWSNELLLATNWLRSTMTSIAVAAVLVTYWTVRRISRRQLQYSFSTKHFKRNSQTRLVDSSQAPLDASQAPIESSSQIPPESSRLDNPEETVSSERQLGALAQESTSRQDEQQDVVEEDESSALASTQRLNRGTGNSRSSTTTTRSTLQQQQDLMQRLFRRSALYMLAYFNSIVWNGIARWLALHSDWFGNLGQPGFLAFEFFRGFFVPFQGALNAVVYIYPLVQDAKKQQTANLSTLQILQHLIVHGSAEGISSPSTAQDIHRRQEKQPHTSATASTNHNHDSTANNNNTHDPRSINMSGTIRSTRDHDLEEQDGDKAPQILQRGTAD